MKLKLTLFFLIIYGIANANADVVTIQASVLKESYSDNIKVSGEYVVGIQMASKSRSKSLHVLLQNVSKGTLCVFLSSIDGKYKAKIQYPVLTSMDGVTRISFKSKYRDIMNKYSNEEIAISASLRESCENTDFSRRLVSSWGVIGENTNDLLLLIRSDARKDVAYIPDKKNKITSAKCNKIRENKNISYDKSCLLKGVDVNSIIKIELTSKNLQPVESTFIRIN